MSERYDKDQLIDDIACAAHGWGRDVRKTYLPLDLPARVRKLRADAQALADVRTLDDWAKRRSTRAPSPQWFESLQRWTLDLIFVGATQSILFEGATPDEARAKAAAWVREQAREVQGGE